MKNIKLFTLFLILSIVFISLLPLSVPQAAAVSDIEAEANAAVLAEAATGNILYAKNENAVIAPAGMVKIITALLAVEAYENGDTALTDIVTVSDKAYNGLTAGSSSQVLEVGEEVSFEDLLYCILISSSNEACNAMAEYISGDISAFVSLMNTRAAELGCTSTHFTNTHGLPDDDQYTTANDIYLITEEAVKHPLFTEASKAVTYTMPSTNKSEARTLKTANKLLIENNKYYYKYATGTKTGYTDSAGYCVVASAEKDGVYLISVVMGAESIIDTDGSTLVKSYSETKRLLDWAFSSFGYRTILDTTMLVKEIPVSMGDGTDSVVLRPMTPVTAFLDNDIDTADFTFAIKLYSEGEELTAPVKAGDILGEVTVSLDGRIYGTSKLVANTNVALSRIIYLQTEVAKIFSSLLVRIILSAFVLVITLYIFFVIRYNRNRKKRRAAERAEAERRRAEAIRQRKTTVGKSFEDIETLHKGDRHR
ncbi:MAG: D-alanyl-D-alanine carboxypeptidase family protein [Oscillospiraceae bacterium]